MDLTNIESIKERINFIKKEQTRIDKLITRNEEFDIFDDSLYEKLNSLEEERNELTIKLESLEQ